MRSEKTNGYLHHPASASAVRGPEGTRGDQGISTLLGSWDACSWDFVLWFLLDASTWRSPWELLLAFLHWNRSRPGDENSEGTKRIAGRPQAW